MTPERFKRLSDVYAAAMERTPAERPEYITKACDGDEGLREEVIRLLDSRERAGGFLVPSLEDSATVTLQPEQGPVQLGTLLKDRYLLVRRLGEGSFGTVYLGNDNKLHDRPVVVKILREHVEQQWFRRKFEEECKALARIRHPGVVGVLDQGEAPNGTPFLVLEFVEGASMKSIITPGGLDLGRTATLIRQIGEALQAAHDQGVYHRDLKPENIMLRDLGRGQEMPVIIDFGIATVRDSPQTDNGTTRVAGSVPYMAPEQYLGRPEAASDIYALGVIAYEMTTGQRPFPEKSPLSHFQSQGEGVKINPRTLRPALPEAAEEAILKALTYDKKDRYASAVEFGEHLARALVGQDEAPVRRPFLASRHLPSRRKLIGVSATAAAIIAAAKFGPRLPWAARTPAQASRSERTLSYYVLVQKFRNGKPFDKTFPLAKEMLFPPDYRIRLIFTNAQEGNLYLINEGPPANDGLAAYNLLFPSPANNGGSSFLPRNQETSVPSGNEFLVFDEQKGAEKLWVVWATRSIPVIETAKKWVNSRDRGRIKDAGEVEAVKNFLIQNSVRLPRIEKDEANIRTLVHGEGDVLVHLLRLEHD
jgi:serine/threonine protein kinase